LDIQDKEMTPMTMSIWKPAIALCLGLFVVAACSSPEPALEPEAQTPPAVQEPIAPPSVEPVQQGATGQLQSIDATTSTISIKDTEGATQMFSYSPATEILGADGVQGLAARQGNDVIVTYTEQDNQRMAVRVEVIPR